MSNTSKALLLEGIAPEEIRNEFAMIHGKLETLTKRVIPPSKDTTVFLTREEVAKLFKVTLPTVWSWTKQGILNPYRIGNQVRFIEKEVLEAAKSFNKKGNAK